MTRRLYLHVGAPKSGTSYLQRILEHNVARLADAGVLVVGETHLDRVHAAMVVREHPRLEQLPPRASAAWARLVEQVRGWSGDTAILSYELFAGASEEQVTAALADLDGLDVHVVITARDLGRAVPSAWQERLKFGHTTPLATWQPPPESAVRSEWGWRTMDPAGVARRWGATLPADHVHVVTVPRGPADPDLLWHRFAAACSLDVDGLDLRADRVNESMGLLGAELLRRVNGSLRPPLDGLREQALWLRDTLAHGVLVHLGGEPIGITDEQHAEALERSAAASAELVEAGYDLHGDVEDLTATRPGSRTPDEVTDSELLAGAVETITRLLLLVRERTRERDQARNRAAAEPAAPVEAPRESLRHGIVRRLATPAVERRLDRMQRTIEELEAEVAASRALQLRVAELSDVVTELLLPVEAADREVTAAALTRYREESL